VGEGGQEIPICERKSRSTGTAPAAAW